MGKNINITLDGPCGSGKTTMAKRVADRLKYLYVDTGAMYRGVAWYLDKEGIAFDDEETIKSVLKDINLELKINDGVQQVLVNGVDVSGEIRTPRISLGASTASKIKEVRLKMVAMQREIARNHNSIFDGRDMGSYVIPHADCKFYLTADIDERAKRRYLELRPKQDVNLEEVKADMIARDAQDSSRDFAPLVIPEGAYVIDTTNLSRDEVENIIIERIQNRK